MFIWNFKYFIRRYEYLNFSSNPSVYPIGDMYVFYAFSDENSFEMYGVESKSVQSEFCIILYFRLRIELSGGRYSYDQIHLNNSMLIAVIFMHALMVTFCWPN